MRLLSLVSLGAIAVGTAAAEFEPENFNVTEALLDNGIDPSILINVVQKLDAEVVARTTPCSLACGTLKTLYGSSKVFYNDALIYWSIQQDEVVPECTFKPATALEVSTMVLLSRLTQCPFAIKAGGHAAFPGASNIAGGITVSLEKMKNVEVLPNNLASVGPGNRWFDIYTALEPKGLAVVGGRASAVGTGLVLGGGISHHINMRGFACDNVAEYQVVTASGVIINVSPSSFPNLFWALRGGGNNFGIVTNYKLETVQQGPMWGGDRYHTEAEIPAIMKAFVNMANNAHTDPKATHYFALSSVQMAPGQFGKFVTVDNHYTEQFPASSPPEIFKEYMAIPTLQDNTSNRTLAVTTMYLNGSQPDGHRQLFWNKAFKLDLDFMLYLSDLFYSSELATFPGFPSVSLPFQAFSKAALEKSTKNGGNALGLSAAEGPYFHILLYPVWDDKSYDAKVGQMARTFMNTAIAEAKKRGVYVDYIYMNYAGPNQEVIKGYGPANQAKLKSIASLYDPTAVFQRLQPGGHKLEGAPIPA